jgi:hypothetical protein
MSTIPPLPELPANAVQKRQRAEPDYKALWEQACKAYDSKNRSGCCCTLDPHTDAVVEPCGVHEEWLFAAIAAEREACAALCESKIKLGSFTESDLADAIRARRTKETT